MTSQTNLKSAVALGKRGKRPVTFNVIRSAILLFTRKELFQKPFKDNGVIIKVIETEMSLTGNIVRVKIALNWVLGHQGSYIRESSVDPVGVSCHVCVSHT